jgi:hypothetical protein
VQAANCTMRNPRLSVGTTIANLGQVGWLTQEQRESTAALPAGSGLTRMHPLTHRRGLGAYVGKSPFPASGNQSPTMVRLVGEESVEPLYS